MVECNIPMALEDEVFGSKYGAFDGSGFSKITIGTGVTSIGSYAFSGCSKLTDIYIPEGVTSIEEGVFQSCSSLASITLPEGVMSIGEGALFGCGTLTSIVLPKSIKYISSEAFAGCPELTDVYCYAETVPSTESDAFRGSYIEYATLHVPDSALASYQATAPWSSFGTIVSLTEEPGEGIIHIPSKAVLISTQGGILTLSGLAEGTEVAVYTTAGTELATATATNGTATLTTGLEAGSIAIVKIGSYSIKVAIK